MKKIKLTRGKYALVDDEDFDMLNKTKWCAIQVRDIRGAWYALTTFEKYKTAYMHRIIMNAPKGSQIDHINRNGLDNRKSNLRFCTFRQNNLNKPLYKTNTSGHRGVHWSKQNKRWVAQLKIHGQCFYLGSFKTLEEAVEREKAEYEKHKNIP